MPKGFVVETLPSGPSVQVDNDRACPGVADVAVTLNPNANGVTQAEDDCACPDPVESNPTVTSQITDTPSSKGKIKVTVFSQTSK